MCLGFNNNKLEKQQTNKQKHTNKQTNSPLRLKSYRQDSAAYSDQ
jgi:hypothetical protein